MTTPTPAHDHRAGPVTAICLLLGIVAFLGLHYAPETPQPLPYPLVPAPVRGPGTVCDAWVGIKHATKPVRAMVLRSMMPIFEPCDRGDMLRIGEELDLICGPDGAGAPDSTFADYTRTRAQELCGA